MATAEGWERAAWALHLAPYLGGGVRAAYMMLGEAQARDYKVLKAAILDWVRLLAERYSQKF